MLSKAVQTHPTVLDFWLIGVYTELDIKGNLFSGRKLMLQAIRNNSQNPSFYLEYFRFEVRFFEKVKQRILILNGDGSKDKPIDFIDDEEMDHEEKKVDDGRLSASTNFIEIVFDNIKEQYGTNLAVIKECYQIAKESILLPESLKESISTYYKVLKFSEAGISQYFKDKLANTSENSSLIQKIASKISILDEVSESIKIQTLKMIEENIIKRMQNSPNGEVQSLFWFLVGILGVNSNNLIEIIFSFYHKLERKSEQFKRLVDKLI